LKLLAILLFGAFFPVPQNAPEVHIYTAAWFPPNLTLTADTALVELGATVRDAHGHPVPGLKADDFEVLDDKQPREITVFAELHSGRPVVAGTATQPDAPAPPPEPHAIALFFDDAHASPLGVHKSAEAARKLIAGHLSPGDRVGIFTASGAISVDFTADRDALLAALRKLVQRPIPTAHAEGYPPMTPFQAYVVLHHMDPDLERAYMRQMFAMICPEGMSPGCGASAINSITTTAQIVWEQSEPQYVSTLDAMGIVLRHLATAAGKRVFLMMTPGFPTGTGPMQKRTAALIDAALRAGIRIGAANSEAVEHISSLRQLINEEFLTAATKSTGGQYFHETNDTASTLLAAAADPEVSYLLGFRPEGTPNGQYHTLKTVIKGSRGYTVEARAGYFDEKGPQETVQQRIDRIAMSDTIARPFPATIQARQEPGGVQVTIAVDAKALKFPEKETRRVQELTMLTVLQDAQGNFVAGKQSVLDLAFTPATLAEKLQQGIQAATSLPVTRPGSYRVREVIRELAQDRIWAGSAALEIK